MILITGASGKTGSVLTRRISKAETVRAFVHRPEQAASAKSLGAAEAILGDMRDKAAVRSAMKNIRAVYHVCPNMSPDEVEIGRLVINEARRAEVEHFVYHSVLHPQTEKMHHHWQKLHVEEMVFEAGLPFTILQPAAYMQNLLAYWKSIVEEGVLRIPYSIHSKFSFVDLEDLAEAANILVTESSHRNAIYELAGTPPMSHVEAAEVFGRLLNRDVHAEEMMVRDWRVRAEQMGLSEYAVENLVKMFAYYDQWGLSGNPNILKWLLKREPTSFDAFVQRILK